MTRKKLGSTLAALLAFAMISIATAEAASATDGTKFKGKTVEMKDKGEVTVLLSFPAGKEVTATTDGEKQTDVHLFVYDAGKKEVGKDVSPGPKCEVKFTPEKAGTYKLVVKNEGPGPNKVTLGVKVAN